MHEAETSEQLTALPDGGSQAPNLSPDRRSEPGPSGAFRWGRLGALLTGSVVILGVITAPAVVRHAGVELPALRVVLSALVFGLLVSPALSSRSRQPVGVSGLAGASLQLFGGVLFTVAAIAVLGWWPVALPVLLVVLVPAAVEEGVFRRALPLRLAKLLARGTGFERRYSLFIGQIASQALFAASHFVSREGLWASRGGTEAFRLFAAGVLYANLAERRGLWLAVGAHTTLNLGLQFGDALLARRVGLLTAALVALVGMYGLFRLSGSAAHNATTA